MLLQRLATGATAVKQARYRRGPTRGAARHSTRMRSIIRVLNSAEHFSALVIVFGWRVCVWWFVGGEVALGSSLLSYS